MSTSPIYPQTPGTTYTKTTYSQPLPPPGVVYTKPVVAPPAMYAAPGATYSNPQPPQPNSAKLVHAGAVHEPVPVVQHQANASPFHPEHEQQQQQGKHNPFEPRFAVEREEVSDEEWREAIESDFHSSGIVPAVLASAPAGLVNVNYGTHNCVHMGTDMESEITAYEPSAVSWNVEDKDQLHAMVMFDLDMDRLVHWMVVNIPGSDVGKGDVIAEYNSPVPDQGHSHRYVFVAMEQNAPLPVSAMTAYASRACQTRGRKNFRGVEAFRRQFGLGDVAAANYFTVNHDSFVDSIVAYCADRA